MANYNKITESTFRAVKLLLDGGATVSEAAEYMKISTITVYAIRNAENYTEYRQVAEEKQLSRKRQIAAAKAKEAHKEPAPQIVEHKQTVTIQATHFMMQELQKTNELLNLISNKLAYIVDELCGVPQKEVNK